MRCSSSNDGERGQGAGGRGLSRRLLMRLLGLSVDSIIGAGFSNGSAPVRLRAAAHMTQGTWRVRGSRVSQVEASPYEQLDRLLPPDHSQHIAPSRLSVVTALDGPLKIPTTAALICQPQGWVTGGSVAQWLHSGPRPGSSVMRSRCVQQVHRQTGPDPGPSVPLFPYPSLIRRGDARAVASADD